MIHCLTIFIQQLLSFSSITNHINHNPYHLRQRDSDLGFHSDSTVTILFLGDGTVWKEADVANILQKPGVSTTFLFSKLYR